MTPYNEVFKRVEKKYLVDARQRRRIEGTLREFMEPDAYGLARVTSLYLDTPDNRLIERSLEKPLYKEKLRLRAYGDADGDALMRAFANPVSSGHASGTALGTASAMHDPLVFLELKKKFDGVVYKRRVGFSLQAACAYLDGMRYTDACRRHPLADPDTAAESLSTRSLQIADEIDAMRARHPRLRPAMGIACERVAWAPKESCAHELGELRITFDGSLAFAPRSGRHAAPSMCGAHAQRPAPCPGGGFEAWRSLIDADESIMEIKSAGALPLWLVEALADVRAYPSSFSKYGAAYTAHMKGALCA